MVEPTMDDRLGMLERYLATCTENGPAFVVARSRLVDELLCRWLLLGHDVGAELRAALGGRSGTYAPRWVGLAARAVHPLHGVARRLGAYLDVLSTQVDLPVPGADDDTLPVAIAGREPGACARPELASLVGSWAAPSSSTALRLQTKGPLLSSDISGEHGRVRERTFFQERLAQELRRAERHDLPLSVALVQLLEPEAGPPLSGDLDETQQVGALVAANLRLYDVLCRDEDNVFLLMLPGVAEQGCAAVVARLRGQLGQIRVAVGNACFPVDGVVSAELLAGARQRLALDRARQIEGTVEMDRVPASMVEQLAEPERPPTIWFQGLPGRMPVQVLRTEEGIRLKLPLSFLTAGKAFRLDVDRACPFAGVVREALVSKYRAADDSPVVYLDVTRQRPV